MPIALRLALAVAVSSALYAAAVSLPLVATPFLVAVPLPGLVLGAAGSMAQCGLWLVLTAAATGAALGSDALVGFVLPLGLPALVVAAAIWRSWSLERTVVVGVAAWSAGVASVALLTYGSAAAVAAAAREQLEAGFNLAVAASASLGADGGAAVVTEADRAALVEGMLGILPALVVLTGALTVIGNLVVLRSFLGVQRDVNLRLWRTPDPLIWALILAGFGMYLPVPWLPLTAENIFVVLLGCYFCQGLAIVAYYLDRFRLPRGIRVAGYVLIAVQHIITVLVLALGIFDLWGNFRRSNASPADVRFDADGE